MFDPRVLNGKKRFYERLKSTTEISKVVFLNEIRVPYENENVVAIVDYEVFVQALHARGGRKINPHQFADLFVAPPPEIR